MPPPVPSACLGVTGQDAVRRGAAQPGERLERPHSSGAVALTAALPTLARSSGGTADSLSGQQEQRSTSGTRASPPQDASAHSTHAAPREGALPGGHDQLRDARPSAARPKLSAGGERAALLASRPDESCCVKPKPARRARASKAGSDGGGAFRWTQLWPVRLCADCARRGHQ